MTPREMQQAIAWLLMHAPDDVRRYVRSLLAEIERLQERESDD